MIYMMYLPIFFENVSLAHGQLRNQTKQNKAPVVCIIPGMYLEYALYKHNAVPS